MVLCRRSRCSGSSLRRLRVLRCTRTGLGVQKSKSARQSRQPAVLAVPYAREEPRGAGFAAATLAAQAGAAAAVALGLSETALRNIALEAVRVGNYWAEPEQQDDVLLFIAERHAELLADSKFLKKNARKLQTTNGIVERYTAEEILAKRHEADGFNVFLDPEEALAAAACEKVAATRTREASLNIFDGCTLIAKKDVRVFATLTSWRVIRKICAGQSVQAAGTPTQVGGFFMVPVKPEGFVEVRYVSLPEIPLGTSTEVACRPRDEQGGDAGLGQIDKLSEGLAILESAEKYSCGMVEVGELLELLEGCASLGELGPAVYCGSRLLAVFCGADEGEEHDGQESARQVIPKEVLERAFTALKPLLRRSATVSPAAARLQGVWSRPPRGRFGVPNHRKALGHLLNRFALLRKGQELQGNNGGRVTSTVDVTSILAQVCALLAPRLASDAVATAAKRRVVLNDAVVRLCTQEGLSVSQQLAWVITMELERLGAIVSRGRVTEVCGAGIVSLLAESSADDAQQLGKFVRELAALEAFASARLERRKKRQKSREQSRLKKRGRKDCAES